MAKVTFISGKDVLEFNTDDLQKAKAYLDKEGKAYTALGLGYRKVLLTTGGENGITVERKFPKAATDQDINASLLIENKGYRTMTKDEVYALTHGKCDGCGKMFKYPNIDPCLPGSQYLFDYCPKCRKIGE